MARACSGVENKTIVFSEILNFSRQGKYDFHRTLPDLIKTIHRGQSGQNNKEERYVSGKC
jgi:hypothetical protein